RARAHVRPAPRWRGARRDEERRRPGVGFDRLGTDRRARDARRAHDGVANDEGVLMLSIVYSPALEITGGVTVVLLVGWFLQQCWFEAERALARRRRRERRRIERA